MAREEYLKKHKTEKNIMKCFLVNGTMLSGKIIDYDEKTIILDKCLISDEKIISITPQ